MLLLCFVPCLSLLFPRPLHLPLRTDVPLRDRQPLFVQTQACPILCCVCVCVCLPADLCMPSSGFCVTSRKSQEKQKWTLCKQPVTKLSNSLFILSIMFSADELFSVREGMDSVLSLVFNTITACVEVPVTARCVELIYNISDPKFIENVSNRLTNSDLKKKSIACWEGLLNSALKQELWLHSICTAQLGYSCEVHMKSHDSSMQQRHPAILL